MRQKARSIKDPRFKVRGSCLTDLDATKTDFSVDKQGRWWPHTRFLAFSGRWHAPLCVDHFTRKSYLRSLLTLRQLGDILGRRKTIFLAATVQLVGAVLMATSYSLAQFVVGRVCIGLGTGGIVATVPIWQSELSRAESRGSHVSSMGIYCGTGLSLALWIAFGMSFASGEVTWR